MPLDLFGSARTTAVVLLASASFTSPIVVKSDFLANAADALGSVRASHVEPAGEQIVAGGTSFSLPSTWGQMGSSQLPSGKQANGRSVGAVVSGVCPAGRRGASCTGGVSVTFIAYDGAKGAEIPEATALEAQFDRDLAKRLRGFRKGEADSRPAGDGGRYLHYSFTYGAPGARHSEVLAAFRRTDGSGVIAIAEGPMAGMAEHGKAIDAFLDSGTAVE